MTRSTQDRREVTEMQAMNKNVGSLIVVAEGEGLDVFPGKWKITKDRTRGDYALVEVNDNAIRGIDPHKHTREDETWYVIEGELAIEFGGEKYTATPGTLVHAPRDIPHSYKVTKVPARYLIIFSPAGIESYFAEMMQVRRNYRADSVEFRNQRDDIAAKYGLYFMKKHERQM